MAAITSFMSRLPGDKCPEIFKNSKLATFKAGLLLTQPRVIVTKERPGLEPMHYYTAGEGSHKGNLFFSPSVSQ